MTKPDLGLWIDCVPTLVCLNRYWGELRRLGISTAAIMVDTSRPRWDPTWTMKQLEVACELARRYDVEVVLTVRPSPDRLDIDMMLRDIDEWLSFGFSAVELNCEGQWKACSVKGFDSIEDAGYYLHSGLSEITRPLDIRIELTTHSGHRESGKDAVLSPLVDRLYVRAYSIRHRLQGRTVNWESPHGPGRLQRRALARAHGVRDLDLDGPRLGVGLALWDQEWPGHPPGHALRTAYDTAVEYGPVEIRLLSSKWLLGVRAQPWAVNAVLDIGRTS